MPQSFTLEARFVDIEQKNIYPATIVVEEGKIASVTPLDGGNPLYYALPGFIDSHVHIESSMLIPSEFARLAVVHGTVATVSDPHEIANVCGLSGIDYMIENGRSVPFKFNFGAPSCVPATTFETAGAAINSDDIEQLMARPEIRYLSEMMNFPGVLHGDEEVVKKIAAAHRNGKPVDGHAPGLQGEEAKKYIDAGISTDHECFTAEEALDKLHFGMKILIREGSAAKNFEALAELLHQHSDDMMFCSDDKHPDSLVAGHINQLCARAIGKGIDLFKILKAACINPIAHYHLDVGQLRPGDPADFILVKDLAKFEVAQTYIDGALVAEGGQTLIERKKEKKPSHINQFNCTSKIPSQFAFPADATKWVMEALDGQLITNKLKEEGLITVDPSRDLLKIAVVNRYQDAPIAIAFIKNFGLKRGAIASSVAHDSHNIVAVGADDESLCRAVNLVIEQKGGISLVGDDNEKILSLPVAGLMSSEDGYVIAEEYAAMDAFAKELGTTLSAPFMTLSFMALLVIPHLKLSDRGLFDGDSFSMLYTAR